MAFVFRERQAGDTQDWKNLPIIFTLDVNMRTAKAIAKVFAKRVPGVVEILYNRKGTSEPRVMRYDS